MIKIPTLARLRELLTYDPLTGEFHYLVRRGSMKPGDRAGTLNSNGHRQITIDGRFCMAHHLAWLWMTGNWPIKIDHADLDKDNNRFLNLREATHAQNIANTGPRKNNKLGVKGVVQLPSGRFQAAIRMNKKQTYLGSFDTLEDAASAYATKAVEVFGEFART